ncbi:hypothetical protein DOY81_000439 [Sarcophaga bullata]|nr:hypothetical protein DOY81_000439 [Sarcophaga bullata]
MVIQWSFFSCILFLTYLQCGHLLTYTPKCNCQKFRHCKWPTQPKYGAINTIPTSAHLFTNTIQPHDNKHSNATPKPVIPNHLPNVLPLINSTEFEKVNSLYYHLQHQANQSHGMPSTPTTRKSVHNSEPLNQPISENSTENLLLTNGNETNESPLLLSSEDSTDNLPITDFINSSSPADTQHSNDKVQGNAKTSKHLIKSVQKSMISNKASTVPHPNLKPNTIYVRNPLILMVIVILAIVVLVAVIAGIVIHARMKSCN